MHDLVESLQRRLDMGRPMAIAIVVGVTGTSPRPLGAKLIVTDNGEMAGSVSGGCVEAAVVQEAQAVLETGIPRLLTYGIADALAQSVGLTCGGVLDVLVLPLSHALALAYIRAYREQRTLTVAMWLEGNDTGALNLWSEDGWHHSLELPPLPAATVQLLGDQLAQNKSLRIDRQRQGTHEALFLDVCIPAARLVIVGAVHIAIPLVTLANTLGFRTVVVDARSAFATQARFGHATELRVGWPADILPTLGLDNRTFIVTLTHDDKLDLPALAYALETRACFVGALGSRRTLPERLAALRNLGVAPESIARLRAPVGLDLGGRLPEEIALAILAEIVAVRNDRLDTTRYSQPQPLTVRGHG